MGPPLTTISFMGCKKKNVLDFMKIIYACLFFRNRCTLWLVVVKNSWNILALSKPSKFGSLGFRFEWSMKILWSDMVVFWGRFFFLQNQMNVFFLILFFFALPMTLDVREKNFIFKILFFLQEICQSGPFLKRVAKKM